MPSPGTGEVGLLHAGRWGRASTHTLLAVGAEGTWKVTETPDSLGMPHPASLRWQQTEDGMYLVTCIR